MACQEAILSSLEYGAVEEPRTEELGASSGMLYRLISSSSMYNLNSSPWPRGWPSLQADRGQAADGAGGDGAA
jgi:hypothetical protein